MSIRVFELAKELGLTSKELLALLKKKGREVENHMSVLKADTIAMVKTPAGSPTTSSGKKTTTTKRASARGTTTKRTKASKKAEPAKAGRRAAVAPPAETPSRPAKRTVLIKKKKMVEEPAAPAVDVTVPEIVEGAESDIQTEGAPLRDAVPPAEALPAPPSLPSGVSPTAPATPEAEPVRPPAPEAAAPPPAARLAGEPVEEPTKPKRFKVAKEEMFDFRREVKKVHDFKPFQHRGPRVGIRKMQRRPPGIEVQDASKPRRKGIKLSPGLTIKEFAETIGQKAGVIISRLMEMGIMSTINQPVDLDAALLIAESFEIKAEIVAQPTEEELLGVEVAPEPTDASFVQRPPVVTIMGHVDHGKTSLLDAIRATKVVDSEAGGITQHIGAYIVDIHGRQVTFFDTPGHEAFTAMRARGAKVTDLVVLVVAADDGVMPQTVEAIHHAKAAGVPIIVAINKIDKPEAQPERVQRELSEHELIPEQWGGSTIFVNVSAKNRTGVDALLEMILLQSEVLELRARPSAAARGSIIEARLDRGRGPVATVLIQDGTLRVGDIFVCGVHAGRIRGLTNDVGQRVKEAGPSLPVEVIGLDGVPQAGDPLLVVADERAAKEVATVRMQRQRTAGLAGYHKVTLEDFHAHIQEGEVKELNVVIKADVQGSVEALKDSLERLSASTVKIKVIHSGAGGITESDVLLASSSNALIIGFHVRPDAKVQALAKRETVDIRIYDVIYAVTDDIKTAMEGLLEPIFKERIVGRAEVRQTFSIPKAGVIAGAYVTEGTISRSGTEIRVVRDSVQVYEGRIGSLRRFKDDVREVQSGYECGISIENYNDLKVGDVLEVFVQDQVAAKLEG